MINKLAISLLTIYGLSNGQGPPPGIPEIPPFVPIQPPPATTASSVVPQPQTTASGVTPGGGGGFIPIEIPNIETLPPGTIIPPPAAAQTTAAPPAAPQTTAAAPPATPVTTASIPVPLPQTTRPQAPVTTASIPVPVPAPATTTAIVQTPGILPAAPAGYTYGAFGQLCSVPNGEMVCQTTTARGFSQSIMKCEYPSDCCLCQSVACIDCQGLFVGAAGLFGVQNVLINGRDPAAGGAELACKGTEACMYSKVSATNIKQVDCTGSLGCKEALITINNPVTHFTLNCQGMAGCQGAKIELIIPPTAGCSEVFKIDNILCKGQESCKDLELTIRNNNIGCKAEIVALDCLGMGNCDGMKVLLEGDVDNIDFVNCQCGPSCKMATGIEKCFHNLEFLFCPDPLTCRGTDWTLVNPADGFILKCAATGACMDSTFRINLDLRSGASMFDAISCSTSDACKDATFIVDNQGLNPLTIEKIECGGARPNGGCNGLTLIVGHNVQIGAVYCNAGQCSGCVIKRDAADPGIPCDPNALIAPPQNVQPVNVIPVNSVPVNPNQYIPGRI